MPVRYFPFIGDTYKPQMGLKPLDWAQWLEFDEQFLPHLALKKKLFQEERSTVLQLEPGTDAYCLELHAKLKKHLLGLPGYSEEGGRFRVQATGEEFGAPTRGEEALEQISRWAQEDWCLLTPTAPFRLVAGFVCFPSRWSLREKMGRDPEGVHGPVPGFKELLANPTKNFLEKVNPERPMWRLNWTIHDSDQLFCPGPHASGKVLDAGNVIENCFLRVERQTLCRLPETGAIAFSIRTHLNPLTEVMADPEKARLLRDSIRLLPQDTADYKGMGPFLPALREALENIDCA